MSNFKLFNLTAQNMLNGLRQIQTPILKALHLERFGPLPSREFLLPELKQIEKIYFILMSMHYKNIEQTTEAQSFCIEATRQASENDLQQHLRNFKSFSIIMQGTTQGLHMATQAWRIRVTLRPPIHKSLLSPSEHYLAGFVLEDLMSALSWQNAGIIQYPPPSS